MKTKVSASVTHQGREYTIAVVVEELDEDGMVLEDFDSMVASAAGCSFAPVKEGFPEAIRFTDSFVDQTEALVRDYFNDCKEVWQTLEVLGRTVVFRIAPIPTNPPRSNP